MENEGKKSKTSVWADFVGTILTLLLMLLALVALGASCGVIVAGYRLVSGAVGP